MERSTKWYVIRSVNNKEKKAVEQLERELSGQNYSGLVKQIVIPMEKTYHTRAGKKVMSERNHYPGYILIETDPRAVGELRSLFKGVNFIQGFLGGDTPVPLRNNEVEQMLGKIDELANADEIVLDEYFIGESVSIISGPFDTFKGKVTEVNSTGKKLKLDVKIFGRETPMEVEYAQVTKDI